MKFLLLILPIFAMANKGLEITQKIDTHNTGFVGEESKMTMVLINAQGDKIKRELISKTKEIPKDGDKSLIKFLIPKDVEGTKMLTWSHKKDDDDQWLFLPSLKKTKRIHSSNKTSSFMGSEFSYEDLGSQEVEKYNYKFISEDDKNWVIERTPLKKSGYSKQVSTISKKYMNAVKIDYFNKRKELMKTAFFDNFKEYSVGKKKMYRAGKIHMKNLLTKKESILEWSNRRMGIKHKDTTFKKEGLNETF